ncbi:MAG: hypothetical protein WC081_03595, partial [Candidatus Ratteibacteria bacterium]
SAPAASRPLKNKYGVIPACGKRESSFLFGPLAHQVEHRPFKAFLPIFTNPLKHSKISQIP